MYKNSIAIISGVLLGVFLLSVGTVFAAKKDVTPKKILAHKTSLTQLGIPVPQGKGNAADLWMKLQGTESKPGPWKIKFEKLKEETSLDPGDVKILLRLASYSKFSFYPEPYPLPKSILEFSQMEVPVLGQLRSVSRRAVAQAAILAKQGKKAEAKNLLQAIIIIGRQLQEDQFATSVQFLVGIGIEKIGADALSDFYTTNKDITRSTLFSLYSQEIDSLKKVISDFMRQQMTMHDMFLFSFVLTTRTPTLVTRDLIKTTIYTPAHTTEQEVQDQLESLLILDDPTLQKEAFLPLVYMRNTSRATAFAPESTLATKALLQYTKSKNPWIVKYAKQALALTPEQVLTLIQEQLKQE